MSAYVIDSSAAVELAAAGYVPAAGDSLLAPTLLRSEVLAALRREVASGGRAEKAARALLAAVDRLPVRLLGDRVSRATAFRLADELDWEDTAQAEYLAVATLQADVLVTDDPDLRAAAGGRIEVGDYEALWR